MNAFVLAIAYLRYHSARSLIIVFVMALILFIPFASQILLSNGEQQLTSRAEATPFVLGRQGSATDLILAALYFSEEQPMPVTMREVEEVWDSGLATPIPLHSGFSSNGHRIIGTTLDYFAFRGLDLAEGRGLAILGEAVIGANVAKALGKGVADHLVSSPETPFDLNGAYPLELSVVGVLAPSNSADDDVIFVDMKTAWVIAGIGHAHDETVAALDTSQDAATAIVDYRQITQQTLGSFHFHGAESDYPVSAVIAVPKDLRAATLLQGRYLDPGSPTMIVDPSDVVRGLLDRIFRIKGLLSAVTALMALASFAAIGLALFFSYRLRADEIATAARLGAPRAMGLCLLTAESSLLFLASGGIAAAGIVVLAYCSEAWIGWLLAFST